MPRKRTLTRKHTSPEICGHRINYANLKVGKEFKEDDSLSTVREQNTAPPRQLSEVADDTKKQGHSLTGAVARPHAHLRRWAGISMSEIEFENAPDLGNEARIEELERQKIRLADNAERSVPPKEHVADFIEPALTFLSNPWNIYKKGNFALKRTVLKLAFAEPLRYNRNTGYRTAEATFPFKVLADFSTLKCGMVGDPGIEPGVRLREGVTVPCHTLRPVAHLSGKNFA